MLKKYLLFIITSSFLISLYAMESVDPEMVTWGPSDFDRDRLNADLNLAKKLGDVEGMKKAILAGAYPDDRFADILIYAAATSDIPFIKFLLEHGADPLYSGEHGSALSNVQKNIDNRNPLKKEILHLFRTGPFPGISAAGKPKGQPAP